MSFFRKRSAIPCIAKPKVGLLNLLGAVGDTLMCVDRELLGSIFDDFATDLAIPPRCDVLFVYAKLREDGSIDNSLLSLRELIRDSGAKIVVVASENPGPHYVKAGKRQPFGSANLVMTLDRRGDAFPQYFTQFFSRMQQGISMPVAWVELSPQIPNEKPPSGPDLIFACEIGQLSF